MQWCKKTDTIDWRSILKLTGCNTSSWVNDRPSVVRCPRPRCTRDVCRTLVVQRPFVDPSMQPLANYKRTNQTNKDLMKVRFPTMYLQGVHRGDFSNVWHHQYWIDKKFSSEHEQISTDTLFCKRLLPSKRSKERNAESNNNISWNQCHIKLY